MFALCVPCPAVTGYAVSRDALRMDGASGRLLACSGLVPPGLVEKAIRSAWPGAAVTIRPAGPLPSRGATASRGRMVLARPDHYPLTTTHRNDPLRALLGALPGYGKASGPPSRSWSAR
ncbi:hypothetical protein GCM10009733_082710 [Nonomuraea maheshkhaliensis]|uniref:Uncharacterized protein n=1 Tax=Nonomuraea maheshkhaliensis TaxID=419590 RepID=A0ABN2GL72_9ACTN